MTQPAPTEELVSSLNGLMDSSAKLGVQIKDATRVIDHQTRMLDLALDELIALAGTESIPPFFRSRIAGTLFRIREIGMPK